MRAKVATINSDGGSICLARIQKGLSIRALANKSGLSVAAVSKIERGATKNIRPLSAQKICSALEVPFDDLFTIKVPGEAGEINGKAQ